MLHSTLAETTRRQAPPLNPMPIVSRPKQQQPIPGARAGLRAWLPLVSLAVALGLAAPHRATARPQAGKAVPAQEQPQPKPPIRAGADTSRLRRQPKKQSLINKINRALQWLPGGANWPTIRFEKAESAALPPAQPAALARNTGTNTPPTPAQPNLPKQL